MASINITFDTISKECHVTIDGKELQNVSNVDIYKYCCDGKQDDGYITITMRGAQKDGMSIVQTVYSSVDSELGQELIRDGGKVKDGLVSLKKQPSIEKSIASLLERK